jgi:hypothetical protein
MGGYTIAEDCRADKWKNREGWPSVTSWTGSANTFVGDVFYL